MMPRGNPHGRMTITIPAETIEGLTRYRDEIETSVSAMCADILGRFVAQQESNEAENSYFQRGQAYAINNPDEAALLLEEQRIPIEVVERMIRFKTDHEWQAALRGWFDGLRVCVGA